MGMVEEKWHRERDQRFVNGSARTGDQEEVHQENHRQGGHRFKVQDVW